MNTTRTADDPTPHQRPANGDTDRLVDDDYAEDPADTDLDLEEEDLTEDELADVARRFVDHPVSVEHTTCPDLAAVRAACLVATDPAYRDQGVTCGIRWTGARDYDCGMAGVASGCALPASADDWLRPPTPTPEVEVWL